MRSKGDEEWLRYVQKLKTTLKQIPEDTHGRRELHCIRCEHPVLVSLKWLHEEGNCLKWYGVYPVGAEPHSEWLERCPGCGIVFSYPPPLKEIAREA